MNDTMLGLIDASTINESLTPLTVKRSLSAIPFGGRYRLIDFVLSNMVNSGIKSVAIFPKKQYRSLMDHLGSGKQWDLNRKRDGLFFFPPLDHEKVEGDEFGSFSQMEANLDYFHRSSQEYVVIANCQVVANIDFRDVLEHHKESGAHITCVRKNGRSLNMYILKKEFLMELFSKHKESGFTYFSDVLMDRGLMYQINGYEYDGYVAFIDSIESYYFHSLELLNHEVWKKLFLKDKPIYTKVKDEPPTRYMEGSLVKNSIIANGCMIEGHVENSILFRGVKVGKGTIIKNSIVMQKTQIEDGCELEYVILDKDVKIQSSVLLKGTEDSPLVFEKGTVQGALINT
ncbi:sugar phosphate nucleotidyltransferase [Bacillus suaedaesalsae]|uniref:Glucose-1-phosphate adenylyltransferase n=1 Tax=Bacillus suaedaesalsae TaxID=2810349 RepID=A0ABS2DHX1_9BACI|nr:sugar phosphate nucleotidyltransferase [Bacillus suaedaesalsae]MBM6618044.1 glucose-1-phosphate adenylyltransferase [Bacillus suaedaesalsae]